MKKSFLLFLVTLLVHFSCKKDSVTPPPEVFQLTDARVGTNDLDLSANASNINMPVDQPVVADFSDTLDATTVSQSFFLLNGNDTIAVQYFYLNGKKSVSIKPDDSLINSTTYQLVINNKLKSLKGKVILMYMNQN